MTDTVNAPSDDRAEIAALVADYGGNAAYDAWKRIEVALVAAPKVEQEPVAWIARNYDIQKMGVTQCKNEVERYEQNGWEIEPLYTHPAPAPASDELLEAIAKDAAERVHKNGGCVPQLAYAPILFALQDGFAKPRGRSREP